MAEAAGNGLEVDPGTQEGGSQEVAQVVQSPLVQPDRVAQTAELEAHVARLPRQGAVGFVGEDKSIARQRGAARGSGLGVPATVGGEDGDRGLVEGKAANRAGRLRARVLDGPVDAFGPPPVRSAAQKASRSAVCSLASFTGSRRPR